MAILKKDSIRKAGLVSVTLNLFGKLLGFFNISLIAFYFGANNNTDLFYFIQSLSALIVGILGNTLASVFLPTFIKLRCEESENSAKEFCANVFSYFLLLIILYGAFFYFIPTYFVSATSNFDETLLNENRFNIKLFFIIVVLLFIVDFYKCFLQAMQNFTIPAIVVFVGNVVNCIAILFFGNKYGTDILYYTLIGSGVVQFVFFSSFLVLYKIHPSINFVPVKHFIPFCKSCIPFIASLLLSSVSIFYYDFLITKFSGGTLTAFSFAKKLINIPLEVIFAPLAAVFAPYFSGLRALNTKEKVGNSYYRVVNTFLFISIPITLFVAFFSKSIITVIFKRGEFTQESVNVCSLILTILSFTIFGMSFITINFRFLYAMNKSFWVSATSGIIAIISIIMAHFFTLQFGFIGIPLARTISVVCFSTIAGMVLTSLLFREVSIIVLFKNIAKFSLFSTLSLILSYFFYKLAMRIDIEFVSLLLACSVFTAACLVWGYYIKIEIVHEIFRLKDKMLKKAIVLFGIFMV